jgi:hypothetical protein
MVKCGVLFEVRTEFLNNIQTSFDVKGLSNNEDDLMLWFMITSFNPNCVPVRPNTLKYYNVRDARREDMDCIGVAQNANQWSLFWYATLI